MHNRSKLLIGALTAVLLLALGAESSLANRSLVVSGGGRAFRLTAVGFVFAGTNGVNMTCNVTLSGSIHGAISKTRGSLLGYITEGRSEACRNSLGITPTTMTFLASAATPWHLQFNIFTGTLPAITEVLLNIVNWKWLLRIEALSCLSEGTVPMGSAGTGGAREYTLRSLAPLSGNRLSLVRSEGEEFFRTCQASSELGGQTFTSTPEIRVTLA